MNDMSLLKYLKERNNIDDRTYDNLRYTLEGHIYYFGAHFKSPFEGKTTFDVKGELVKILKEIYIRYKYTRKKAGGKETRVVSNAYFNFNDKLRQTGFDILEPTWAVRKSTNSILGDLQFYKKTEKILKHLHGSDFNHLISDSFLKEVGFFREMLMEQYRHDDIRALFVPNDVSFCENLSIGIFKELKRPSFIFLHGMPGRYNSIDESRSDYLIVWGEKIKEYYINNGFSPDRVLVSGHPYYGSISGKDLRSDLSDILVLAKIGVGAHHSDGVRLYDRGNIIVYLLEVQNVLKQQGVKKVRLRLHPSAGKDWIYKFIDKDFFELDVLPLNASLKRSSLVIGPTSTVFLEAVHSGVNYLVFEPSENDTTLLNESLVPPFDGSEKDIPVAKNEQELAYNLKNNVMVNPEVLNGYISAPFDIGFLREII